MNSKHSLITSNTSAQWTNKLISQYTLLPATYAALKYCKFSDAQGSMHATDVWLGGRPLRAAGPFVHTKDGQENNEKGMLEQ